MSETQRAQANPADAFEKITFIRALLTVWKAQCISDDEALCEVQRVLQGAFITPFGTQFREAHRNDIGGYPSDLPMQRNSEVPFGFAQGGAAPISGSNR